MGFTRRAALTLAGVLGLAGCSVPGTETAETTHNSGEAMSGRTQQHFNRDGELTSPVNNELVRTGDVNNVIHASENIDGLPSISDAIDDITEGDKQTVVVVGGINEISSTVSLPRFTSAYGVDDLQRVGLLTAPDTVIKQSDEANLSTLIEVDGQNIELSVAVNGNKENNSTEVTGVSVMNAQGYNPLKVAAVNCNEGLEIVGHTETTRVEAYVSQCDVGVVERDGGDGGETGDTTPDENSVVLTGHNNEGPFYRKDASSTVTTTVELGVETTTGNAVELIGEGPTTLQGEIRGPDAWAVLANNGRFHAESLMTISCGAGGYDVDVGADGSTITDPLISNVPTGIRIGASGRCNDVTIKGGVMDTGIEDYILDAQAGFGIDLIRPNRMMDGANTGTCIRLGATDHTIFQAELTERNRPRTITDAGNLVRSQITYQGQFNDARRGDIPNLLEGMQITYNADDGLPNYYNGSDWVLPDGTITQGPST